MTDKIIWISIIIMLMSMVLILLMAVIDCLKAVPILFITFSFGAIMSLIGLAIEIFDDNDL